MQLIFTREVGIDHLIIGHQVFRKKGAEVNMRKDTLSSGKMLVVVRGRTRTNEDRPTGA